MRKNIVLIIIVAVFTLAISHNQSSAAGMRWYSFNKGIEAARMQRKPIVVDFYADWCGWCKVMDKSIFSDPVIVNKLSRNYISIKIDFESNESLRYKNIRFTPKEFAGVLGIRGLPTVVFMDKDSEVITILPGLIRPDTFDSLLGYIKDECYKKSVSFKDYVGGRTNCRAK